MTCVFKILSALLLFTLSTLHYIHLGSFVDFSRKPLCHCGSIQQTSWIRRDLHFLNLREVSSLSYIFFSTLIYYPIGENIHMFCKK